MERNRKKVFFILLFCLPGLNCTDFIEPDIPQEENNPYLFISSFESNKQASLKNWISPGPPLVKFSNDVPPSGGSFSVLLKAVDFGASIETTFPVPKGNYNYKFSLWGKNPLNAGEAAVYLLTSQKDLLRGKLSINSKDWKYYNFQENLTAEEGDSMKIVISGASSGDGQAGITWIDLCRIEIIN